MVSRISGDGGQQLDAYELEPQLITGLSEGQYRTKRRLVTYNELPPNLVNAVTSIEDRRFFDHGGVDYFRLLGPCVTICGPAGGERVVPRLPCSLHAASS